MPAQMEPDRNETKAGAIIVVPVNDTRYYESSKNRSFSHYIFTLIAYRKQPWEDIMMSFKWRCSLFLMNLCKLTFRVSSHELLAYFFER